MSDTEESERSRSKSPNRLNRQKLPKKARNYSKRQLLEALKRKKECDAKALAVVEQFLEHVDNTDWFLNKLQDINQCHYQDIVDERSISRLCGYPCCKETLTDIPKKQYHISITSNKVYDITERKKFCSNTCFSSSNFIMTQLLTSPLWLRDVEDIPEFKLLSIE